MAESRSVDLIAWFRDVYGRENDHKNCTEGAVKWLLHVGPCISCMALGLWDQPKILAMSAVFSKFSMKHPFLKVQ